MGRATIIGLTAGGSLLLIYFLTMTVLSGPTAALAQFRALWWLMLPVALTFAIQIGLFVRLHSRRRSLITGGSLTSTTGMVACCAHHLTDLLPLAGFSALAAIAADYQAPILVFGLTANLIGITMLLRQR